MKKVSLFAALTLASAAALAQPISTTEEQAAQPMLVQPAGGTDLFKVLDADGDGMISQDEATAHEAVNKQFDQLDVNQDGQLSEDEFNMAESAENS